MQIKDAIDNGEDEVGALNYVWNNQIIPLISEYFYTDPQVLEEIIPAFLQRHTNSEPIKITRK